MISHFFIDRPIFASALSILITLTGAIALYFLPLAQYPRITPPAIVVAISYPGSSPPITAETVAAPIEQQVNGIEGMLYMSSQMGTDGSYSLTVTFDVWVDLNTALVMVQNRVALAMPQLPTQVQNQGITIRKKTPDILMVVSFFSKAGKYDNIYLSNYATLFVKDELLRVDGVSDIGFLGQRDYSMRCWLDPQKMASLNLTATDVANAIRNENLDAPAGQLGQPPAPHGQPFQFPIDTLGRLTNPEQFGNIIVKTGGGRNRPPAQMTPGSRAGDTFNPLTGAPSSTTTPSTMGSSSDGTTDGSMNGGSTSPSGSTASTSTINSPPATLPGGATTPGGAGGRGGGTTSGGSTGGGGGTTGGAAIGSTTAPSSATGSITAGGVAPGTPPASSVLSGLSINTASTNVVRNGALSTASLGLGPGRPSVGIVRLRDIAGVELGAQNYNLTCTFDGYICVGLAVYQLPGTNALDVGERVKEKMRELEKRFPDGLNYDIGYDTTPFVRESVLEVVRTLVEAILLVALVVMVFLQSWRAVIIPLVAVPVAIVGTFAVMAALGFSLNNISLFGLVLAIGIVVDDAIVVVENVERWLAQGLPPREATRKAMDEVTGPIIAVALVLCAVFVPCAFIGGITGRFFIQFAVTIAVSTLFSTFNSLTLSPALAAILLRPHGSRRDPITWLLDMTLGWLFWAFNLVFGAGTTGYAWTVGKMLRINLVVLVLYGGLAFLAWWLFKETPTGFVPQQDQGRLIAGIQLPDSWSLELTRKAVKKIERIVLDTPGVAHTTTIAGLSFIQQCNSSNFASMLVILDPFANRQKRTSYELTDQVLEDLRSRGVPDTVVSELNGLKGRQYGSTDKFLTVLKKVLSSDELELSSFQRDQFTAKVLKAARDPGESDMDIMEVLREQWLEQVPDAKVVVFGASPIPGLSVAGGFKIIVEDRGGVGLTNLEKQTNDLIGKMRKLPELNSVSTQFRTNTPQLFMEIDRTKVQSLGVSLADVNQTLGMYLGSLYVNSFNEFGRHWQVTAQVDGRYRNRPEHINLFKVRNNKGQMVPLGTLVSVRSIGGPVMMIRYNLYTGAPIVGNLRAGVSSGEAIAAVNKVTAESLPLTMKTEWTELMFVQIKAGDTALYVFALSVAAVFLALAALYESWTLPLAVILVVPLCLLSSVSGVRYAGKDVDIFVQIGLVVLVGLACKNAILIVEFASQLRREGWSRKEATVEASRLRVRPILMTSFAFILGVVPLVLAHGAGAEMRRSLGVAVFSGMLGVTLFGIFLTPVFFYVLQGVDESAAPVGTAVQWIVSVMLGGMIGLAIGFLLARVVDLLPIWSMILGASAGITGALLLLEIRRRMGPRPVPRRVIEHAGLHSKG